MYGFMLVLLMESVLFNLVIEYLESASSFSLYNTYPHTVFLLHIGGPARPCNKALLLLLVVWIA